MKVIYDKNKQNVPIKYWLPQEDLIEEGALEQALNMANLPFVHKHISLMPDTHQGYGVPIGGVMGLENTIIPHAIGVDINCGVHAIKFNTKASHLRKVETGSGSLGKQIAGQLMRNIPLGFNKHNEPQTDWDIDKYEIKDVWGYDQLKNEGEFENAKLQIGTLGSGNHFLELQEDVDNGDMWGMVHSGSRHFGYAIAKIFNEKAKRLNRKWYSKIPEDWELAFLPFNDKYGQAYYTWMNIAMDYARKNRDWMLNKVIDTVKKSFDREINKKVSVDKAIKCNHNYANLEHHFNKNVVVHRKGAIQAKDGQDGIIPGSMGSYSYIVKGKGNEQSFKSASHGAGRRMSRNEAKRRYNTQEMMEDFKNDDIVLLSQSNKDEVLDEYKKAYKNIDDVIEYQSDLINIKNKLKTVAVVKG